MNQSGNYRISLSSDQNPNDLDKLVNAINVNTVSIVDRWYSLTNRVIYMPILERKKINREKGSIKIRYRNQRSVQELRWGTIGIGRTICRIHGYWNKTRVWHDIRVKWSRNRSINQLSQEKCFALISTESNSGARKQRCLLDFSLKLRILEEQSMATYFYPSFRKPNRSRSRRRRRRRRRNKFFVFPASLLVSSFQIPNAKIALI